MSVPRHSIFRDKAVKHYKQSRKKDILPDFGSIPASVFLWILLVALSATGAVAWLTQVPTYAAGAGIVVSNIPTNDEAVALAFFTPDALTSLHEGMLVQLKLGAIGKQVTTVITRVEPGVKSEADALQEFGITINNAQLDQKVAVTLIKLGPSFPVSQYKGSSFSAQVQTGAKTLFASFIGM